MENPDFDEEFSRMESLAEEDVKNFIVRHSHDLTSCSFCEGLFDEYGQSIIAFLLTERYMSGLFEPSADTVKQMCESLPVIYGGIESTAARIEELLDLTRLPDCTSSTYSALLGEMTPGFFNHVEWNLEELSEFLRQRATLPNAPKEFSSEIVSWFHMMSHGDSLETCQTCESVLRMYQASN